MCNDINDDIERHLQCEIHEPAINMNKVGGGGVSCTPTCDTRTVCKNN